jgi:hypothetical protein
MPHQSPGRRPFKFLTSHSIQKPAEPEFPIPADPAALRQQISEGLYPRPDLDKLDPIIAHPENQATQWAVLPIWGPEKFKRDFSTAGKISVKD